MADKKEVIFIHIPKTGGTTINTAMLGNYWQSQPDFNYRHIENGNKKSNSGDIFEAKNVDKFRDYSIFMMLRHPVDRMISEYHFIRERKEFMDLIRTKPKNFEEYVRSKQTQNGVVNFLVGRRMYDITIVKEDDLNNVIKAVDELPIHVGIFEEFNKSMAYFTNKTGVIWRKKVEVKRMTFIRPKVSEVSEEIRALILKYNALDLALYEHCLVKFEMDTSNILDSKVSFVKDKYNHIIPYAKKWCFYEFCMDNKKFIQANFEFFRRLNLYLLNGMYVKNGSNFAEYWNGAFIAAVNHHFPETEFAEILNASYNSKGDQLEETAKVGKAVDDFFRERKQAANQFYKVMTYSDSFIPRLESKGFLKKLFKNK